MQDVKPVDISGKKEIIQKVKIDKLKINDKGTNIRLFISVINQLDAQNFCFTINLFHASTCFEHMCSSSGGQNCTTQPLVSSHQRLCSAILTP